MKEREMHQTIRGLYEGILDPTAWRDSMARLRDACHSMHASLVLCEPVSDRHQISEIHDANPQLVDIYNEHYESEDPSKPYMRQLKMAGWYIDSRDLGPASIGHLPFYQKFLRGFGLSSVMGCLISASHIAQPISSCKGPSVMSLPSRRCLQAGLGDSTPAPGPEPARALVGRHRA